LSEEYPLAKLTGVGASPKFSKYIPRNNLQFIQSDILKGLPFENNSFDFVHMRFFRMSFIEDEWEEKVIKEILRVCKPSGWVELLDLE
ncbi:hypothetical protein C1645_678301, partial [Glomus cerebriforme]